MTENEAAAQLAAITETLKSLPEDADIIGASISFHGPPQLQLSALPVPATESRISGEYVHVSAMLGGVLLVHCRPLSLADLEAVKAATIAALRV